METSLHVSQASPGSLPLCRDAQAQELMRLLQLHISSCQGGSVYVSGLPGTGLPFTLHWLGSDMSIDLRPVDQLVLG